MTSLSVRAYTTGIYRQLGLKEEEVTKVQTGGPDGDVNIHPLSNLNRFKKLTNFNLCLLAWF